MEAFVIQFTVSSPTSLQDQFALNLWDFTEEL